ncbi:hypothetical protein FA13DRAFT_1571958, partial [Coprinellus micaceus]
PFMAPHLSPQLRQRIVQWRYTDRRPVREIVQLARCSERTVYSVLACHREYGQFSNPFAHTRGRRRALEMADITYLLSALQANPSLYLDELQEQLSEVRGVD